MNETMFISKCHHSLVDVRVIDPVVNGGEDLSATCRHCGRECVLLRVCAVCRGEGVIDREVDEISTCYACKGTGV